MNDAYCRFYLLLNYSEWIIDIDNPTAFGGFKNRDMMKIHLSIYCKKRQKEFEDALWEESLMSVTPNNILKSMRKKEQNEADNEKIKKQKSDSNKIKRRLKEKK